MKSHCHQLERLAEQVRALEQAEGAGEAEAARLPTGWDAIDAALGGGLTQGGVHEWFTATSEADAHPPITVLMHLARQTAAAGSNTWAIWVGRSCWPYPHGLDGDDESVLGRCLFVDPADAASRLWALALAARCEAVGVVIGDGTGLDMAATRRLQLTARDANTPILLARDHKERGEVSAAATRWTVSPTWSPTHQPRWRIELWRCKGMQGEWSTEAQRSWVVELSRAGGFVFIPASDSDRATPTQDTPGIAQSA
jgi:protein ImuA